MAYTLDSLLLTAIVFLGAVASQQLLGPAVRSGDPATGGPRLVVDHGRFLMVAVVSAMLCAAYFITSWTMGQATPGQRLLRLRVEGAQGQLSLGQAATRWLLLMGPLSFGAILAAVAPRWQAAIDLAIFAWFLTLLWTAGRSSTRQGLHDRLARTIVTTPEQPSAARSRAR